MFMMNTEINIGDENMQHLNMEYVKYLRGDKYGNWGGKDNDMNACVLNKTFEICNGKRATQISLERIKGAT